MTGFYATFARENRQVRKEAAVNDVRCVPWSCLVGVGCLSNTYIFTSKVGARSLNNYELKKGGFMANGGWEPTSIPKIIGGFNIPKAVIEAKIDTLTFLEILIRKGIITSEELDEIRAAVVEHLNILYPELKLSYTTPPSLSEQAPIQPTKPQQAVPLYASQPPPLNLFK